MGPCCGELTGSRPSHLGYLGLGILDVRANYVVRDYRALESNRVALDVSGSTAILAAGNGIVVIH